MREQLFKGTGVALITPFDTQNNIDFPALERMINHVIDGGIDYIVSLGTTGEAITLNSAECQSVLDFTVKITQKRVPLVAGCFGHNNTAKLVQKLHNANLNGFDAILSSSPSYNKPTQEGIYQHYIRVAAASPLPIIIYNVPSRTGSNIEPSTIVRLANANDKFIAIKEASGDITQASSLIKHTPKDFLVLSGDDPTALALMACGGDGIISVIGNAFPKAWSSLTKAILNGNLSKAQQINNALWDIHPLLYIEGNPVGVKAACETLGLCRKNVRLPLVELSKEQHLLLETEIQTYQKKQHQTDSSAVKN